MSERLKQHLLARIRADGPISFAAYMQVALYDPEDGFFARPPVGRDGHFATSPHVSGVFAALLGAQVVDAWEALDRPATFTVAELGAGDGTLARGIVEAMTGTPAGEAVRYVAVEQSVQARAAIEARGIQAAASLDDVAQPFDGLVLANELLDNLPFHRLRVRARAPMEVFVGEHDGSLVEVEADPTVEAGAPGGEGECIVRPAQRDLVHEVAAALRRGYALFIDYGSVTGEDREPVRGYRAQRLVHELLADPGGTDITGPVDFDALARDGAAAGLQVWGPVSQRDALHALGYRRALDAMRARQAELEAAGEAREAVEVWNARGEAAMLVDPAGLGSLKVMAFGTDGLPAPRALR